MKIPADLHIHSPYSRATSPRLSPAWLDRWARIKGIGLLGTGDCTHARWLEELREQLDQGEEGFYTLKREIRSAFNSGPALEEGLPEPGEDAPSLRFVLTGEISTIYKKDGKTRKVHHLVILPGFSSAAAFNAKLERLGNIRSDGRPILGIDSRDLLSLLLETDENAILIPAHIWTPWFSVLGAKSGFDSIDACYGDLASYIPAVETGLSSNPPMNWALSGLDRFSIISNSDAHSPDKLGREATIFEMEQSYASLRKALRHEGGKILGTIEFFPQEGKYHYDGHRKCGVCLDPAEAAATGGICPVCGKVLTRGVMSRVLELADREVDETAVCPPDTEAANRRPYYSLIPLNEILGELLGRGGGSKKVEAAYGNLIKKGGSEFSLLMEKDLACIEGLKIPGLSGELLAEAIGRMRSGKVLVDPGYDGEYGSVKVFDGKVPAFMGGSLFEELPGIKSAEKAPGIPKAAAGKKDGPKRNAPAPPQGGTFSFVPDQAQQEAVAYNGRRALIIAGPGTGKTAVLADRIVRLIEKEGADPASILAVSFTIKAAAELRERILRFSDPSGGADPAAVTAATFHSFCCSVLREEYAAAGLRQDFKILGEEERDALLAGICSSDKNRRGRKKTAPRRLGGYIEERKRFLLLPGETTSLFAAECPAPDPLLEELYGEYRLSLREGGALDFEDLVAGAVRLLFAQERVLRSLRRRFRYIFVDEYQDINLAQYALIRRLAPGDDESPSLWVIGDPDQAIYGFRGSDKRFIDRFLEDYPEACRFELTRSFRCAEPIIRAAGQLTGKQLKGVSLEAPDTELKLFRTGYPSAASEAEGIARSIAGLVGGTSFFAIDSLRRVHTPAPWG
ncbi:MAG: UvrD-helicase domain-containing protein, partial [Treponema sp.]|nr:UvrD-helicase domain-containing protein [Treponema sp.]